MPKKKTIGKVIRIEELDTKDEISAYRPSCSSLGDLEETENDESISKRVSQKSFDRSTFDYRED